MVSSPYLAAIQSLGGTTPGENFRRLNIIANEISSSSIVNYATGDFQNVPPPLTPLARVPVGKKLKNNEIIIESLKSEDRFVVNEALKAKFFFSLSNPDLKPQLFIEKIIPFVSLQTRFRIIKKLSICLIKDEKLAEDFFNKFWEFYGEQAVFLLIACSENFIYDKIIKYKIIINIGMLDVMFRIKPNVVIQYLHLGNQKNTTNIKDREHHKISINKYEKFLPKLVKNHLEDFMSLIEELPYSQITLDNKKTVLFLKKSKDTLIQKPKIFLDILNIKIVCKKLTESEFETMFKYLFHDTKSNFNASSVIKYMDHYPKVKKFELLSKTFKEVYGEEIWDNAERIADPDLLLLMPDSLREKQALRLLEEKINKYGKYYVTYNWQCYLPPKDSVPLFQESIKKESDMYLRAVLIEKMIYTCHVYEDKNELSKVLKYYNERHKNEQVYVLQRVFEALHEYWIEKFDDNLWEILKEIIQRAYIKDELLKISHNVLNAVIDGLLHSIFKNSDKSMDEKNKDWYDKLIKIIVELVVKESHIKFNFLKENMNLEHEVISKTLTLIPEIYPDDHDIWKKESLKTQVIINCLETMVDFNSRNNKKLSDEITGPDGKIKPFKFKDYAYLVNFIKVILLTEPEGFSNSKERLKGLLKLNEPKVYKEFVFENPDAVRYIDTEEALCMLRKNPECVIKDWKDYLSRIKDALLLDDSNAKQFMRISKWYKDIPINFVSHALENVNDEGYILVLGILLEGEMFSKVITPFIPKDSELDLDDETTKDYYKIVSKIPSAIMMTNPPCDLNIVASFCRGDYLSVTIKCLTSLAPHVPLPSITGFAKKLITGRVSVKKHGVRIIAQVSPRKELLELLKEMWNKEKHYSIRDILAVEVLNIFQKHQCDETFSLLNKCINELTVHEKSALESMSNIRLIEKKYVNLYITNIYRKIVDLSVESSEFDDKKYICLIMETLYETYVNYIDESVFFEIFNRYLFVPDSECVSRTVQKFAINSYLLSAEEVNFDSRLNLVLNIFKNVLTDQWNKPHPHKTRYYPANFMMIEFIQNLLNEMIKINFMKHEIIIEKISKTFSALLSPCQYPQSYIMLEMCKVFFSDRSSTKFGFNCASKLSDFVKEFSTEFILNDVADCIHEIIGHNRDDTSDEFDVILGLIEGDKLYGSIVGIQLLKLIIQRYSHEERDYKFDSIIEKLKNDSKDNVIIQYHLNKYLNKLN